MSSLVNDLGSQFPKIHAFAFQSARQGMAIQLKNLRDITQMARRLFVQRLSQREYNGPFIVHNHPSFFRRQVRSPRCALLARLHFVPTL